MSLSIGTLVAYVKVDTSGVDKAVKSATGSLESVSDSAAAAGRRAGTGFSAALGKAAKRAALVGAAAVGTAVGATLVGGFKSAVQQENAQKVLSGLYGSTKTATATLRQLNKVAGQSPLGHDAFRKGAESLAYAGVQGKDAVGILKNVGLAITAAGGDTENMGQATDAILRMVNAGKVQLDTLQQLSNSGVPILSGLAAHFGKSIADVNAMASKGKIGLQDVLDVMRKSEGKTFKSMKKAGAAAAKSFGNRWKIAKDNVMNAVGRLLLPLIEKLAPKLSAAGKAVAKFVRKIASGKNPGGAFVDIFSTLAQKVLPPLVDVLGKLAKGAGKAFGFLSKHKSAAVAFTAAIGGLTAVVVAYDAAMAVSAAGGMVKWIKATRIAQGVTKAYTAVQWALNAAMSANPVALVVVALAALGTALVIAYKKSDKFRAIVNAAFGKVVAAGKAVGRFFSKTLPKFFEKAWDKIKSAATSVGKFFTQKVPDFFHKSLDKAKDAVSKGIGKVVDWFQKLPGRVWNALGRLGHVERQMFSNAMNAAFGVVKSLGAKVTGWFKNLPGALKKIGANITKGLIKGIGSLKDEVMSALLGLIPKPLRKFAHLLGIHSPSRVFMKFGKYVTLGFALGISGSRKHVKDSLAGLARLAKEYGDKAIIKLVKSARRHLMRVAGTYDKVTRKLQAAQKRLKSITDAAKDLRSSVLDVVTSTGDVTGLAGNNTFAGIISGLTAARDQAQEFGSTIKELVKDGLNKTTLGQLLDQGPAALAAAKAILSGGATGIKQINGLVGQIAGAGKQIGAVGADALYGAGIKAAQGVVDGLRARKKSLTATMHKLGLQLVKALAHALAKVPSTSGKGGKFQAVPHLATGGRATSPTLAWIGDAHEPETVLRDSQLLALLREAVKSGGRDAKPDVVSRGPLIDKVIQRPGESAENLAERLWFLTQKRG